MAKQLDNTSLVDRLKSAKLLMGPKVSKKLTIDDLEQLALFITEAQTLLNQLGKTLNIKQSNVSNNNSNNQSYNSNSYSSSTVMPYQPLQQSSINTVVSGSGTVPGHNPNVLGFGSLGDVTAYNPELDFINQQQLDVPIFVPSQEQLDIEARLLNDAFTMPEDIPIVDNNAVTQE